MSVSQRIFWTTFGSAIIAVMTLTALMVWLAQRVDSIAASKTYQQVAVTLDKISQRTMLLTEDYAYWTTAFEWYRADDAKLLYDNFGSGASDSPSFDLIYLLDPNGAVSHVYVSDVVGSDLSHFEPAIADAIIPELLSLPLRPYQSVSKVLNFDGDVVVLTAARLQPDDLTGLASSDIPIMIGGIFLDEKELREALFIDDITSGNIPTTPDLTKDSYALPVSNSIPAGHLTWTKPRPGQAILLQAAPIVGLLAILLISGSAIVGKTAARQTVALIHERTFARTDPATGLLNRAGICDVIETERVKALKTQGNGAVVYVDLNGLKTLNDNYGHRVGDEAIRVTALRLAGAVRSGDHVARVGGDEFVCLVLDDDPHQVAETIAARFYEMSADTFDVANQSFAVGSAIGIALSSEDANWDALLSRADAEMYKAKKAQKARNINVSKALLTAS